MKDKIYNAIYGAIVGDALGGPVQFFPRERLRQFPPVTDMMDFVTSKLPRGSWSDDSSMTLCFLDSVSKCKTIDYEDIMRCFKKWLFENEYTPNNKAFDIGRTCFFAISRFKKNIPALECGAKNENQNGNGSLMRISGLPFYLAKNFGCDAITNDNAFEIIHNVSRLTHAHEISLLGCDIYCAFMLEILKGAKNKIDLQTFTMQKIGDFVRRHQKFEYALSKYERLCHINFKDLQESEIKSSGYVLDTLEAALWCFFTTENYSDCVLKAVNLGHDTDTVACVAGSIAGLYYNEVPEKWISTLRNKKLIDEILKKFIDFVVM